MSNRKKAMAAAALPPLLPSLPAATPSSSTKEKNILNNKEKNQNIDKDKDEILVDDDDDEDLVDFESMSTASRIFYRINKFFKVGQKLLIKNFFDYGPPYSNTTFDPSLVNECSKPMINLFELHNLLNKQLNPNLPDPHDLYYTPLHWCCRNAHYSAVKMLYNAGANINLTTELGNTPLDLAVMFNFPPSMRMQQLKIIKFLLIKKEINVNNVDKGGFSAIDHAVINQDKIVIKLLLKYNAKVRRENFYFVGQRTSLLTYITDPEIYKMIYTKLLEEENELMLKNIERKEKLDDENYYKRKKKLIDDLKKKSLKKNENEKKRKKKLLEDEMIRKREEIVRKEIERDEDSRNKFLNDNMKKNLETYAIWQKEEDDEDEEDDGEKDEDGDENDDENDDENNNKNIEKKKKSKKNEQNDSMPSILKLSQQKYSSHWELKPRNAVSIKPKKHQYENEVSKFLRATSNETNQLIYENSLVALRSLEMYNSKENFQKNWSRFTKGGEIEGEWQRDLPFRELKKSSQTTSGSNLILPAINGASNSSDIIFEDDYDIDY